MNENFEVPSRKIQPEKTYSIACRTGCTCCSYENHSLGFYKSKDDAERRIKWFKDPNANNNPLASQYARKGCYSINEHTVEFYKDQIIVDNHIFNNNIIETNEDGTIKTGIEERVFD